MSLNRSGFESYRNYAKPWRMQRIMKDGSINPLDNMRLGQNGQHVNSTGCFGTKTMVMVLNDYLSLCGLRLRGKCGQVLREKILATSQLAKL
jgi:hypothetical protein